MGRGASKVKNGGGGKIFTNAPFDENGNWDEFAKSFGPSISIADAVALNGYVSTAKSFKLNEKFYTGKQDTLTDAEKKTVAALDKTISSHKTPTDGVYTRYVDEKAIQSTLGLSDSQMSILLKASKMDPPDLALLNKALKGTMAKSASYSSTSAVSKHLFNGRPFKREISVPKGTNAFATNPQEHEVIFGRNMKTVLDHVSYNGTNIVLHERFVGYDE